MSRRKKQPPRPHESTRESESFVRIFADMMTSEAWQDLKGGQRNLYECMKLSNGRLSRTERETIMHLPETLTDARTGRAVKPNKADLFFFNRTRWRKPPKDSEEAKSKPRIGFEFRLYSNEKQYYSDRDALIEHGFIQMLEYSKPEGIKDEDETERANRPKALYLLSADWKRYTQS